MIWSKYQRNCVFVGPLDGYCLVCEHHMRTEEEFNLHVVKPLHKKNLNATPYFEKYSNEYIRKVKKGYYCEFCNLLFFTGTKVGLHIVETLHINNKSASLLRRIDNNIIAFENILITDKAWNGFEDNNCVICNLEFENEEIHKTEQSHILNLIMKKVEFGEEQSVYRKADENSYQCLICNLAIGSDQPSVHFKESFHKDELDKCRKAGDAILKSTPIEQQPETTKSTKCEPKRKPPTSEISKEMPINKVNEDENIKQNADTVKTDKNVNKANTPDDRNKKLSKDNANTPIKMDKFICTVLNAKNYVATNHEGNSMCLLCDWTMETCAVRAHVSGRHHQTLVKMHRERLEKISNAEEEPLIKIDTLNDSAADDDRTKIVDSLQMFQTNDISINFETGVATCKNCSKTLNLEYDAMNSHIEEHKKKIYKKVETDPTPPLPAKETAVKNNENSQHQNSFLSQELQHIKKFAKRNKLALCDGKLNCQVCEAVLPVSIKSAKEHVGQHKSSNPSNTPKLPSFTKVPTIKFVVSVIAIESLLTNDVIINEKYNITANSLLMYTPEVGDKNKMKCQACNIVLHTNEIVAHDKMPVHMAALSETMVLVDIENEFIREPRPGILHCGYCSKVFTGWDDMLIHLASNAHRESRRAANWRLREYSSDFQRGNWQREHGLLAFAMNHEQLRRYW